MSGLKEQSKSLYQISRPDTNPEEPELPEIESFWNLLPRRYLEIWGDEQKLIFRGYGMKEELTCPWDMIEYVEYNISKNKDDHSVSLTGYATVKIKRSRFSKMKIKVSNYCAKQQTLSIDFLMKNCGLVMERSFLRFLFNRKHENFQTCRLVKRN